MQISDMLKNIQRNLFQDKEIAHRPKVETKGSLGSITVGPGAIAQTYPVNFQLISDALMAQEWGLVVAQDAVVTSSDPLPIELSDYVQHGGKVYRVVGHPVHDSHDKLILQYQQGLEAV